MTHGAKFTPLQVAMMRLAALPLNYFLELGFFGVASIVFLIGLRKSRPLRPGVIAGITLAAVSVLVCTFLRSGTLEGNDLGWRGFLPAQFVMLLWAAALMVQRGERAEASQLVAAQPGLGAAHRYRRIRHMLRSGHPADLFRFERCRYSLADHVCAGPFVRCARAGTAASV